MDGETEVKTTENKIEETANSENTTESQELSQEAIRRLADSQEMRDFYRALAAYQTSVIFRMRRARSEDQIKKMLTIETERLEREMSELDKRCKHPQVWDPVLGQCV